MLTVQNTLPLEPVRVSEAGRPVPDDAAHRVLRILSLFRACVAGLMLGAGLAFRDPPLFGDLEPRLFLPVASLYFVLAVAMVGWRWNRGALSPGTAFGQLATDVGAVAVFMHSSGGVGNGIGALLVVSVVGAALELRGRYAFLAAAVAVLGVLAAQTVSFILNGGPTSQFVPAGALGGILFMVAAAAFPLARRLEESEALARQRGIDLANLAELNQYIIQNLRESIVVVDEANRVRLINHSAADYLGISRRRAAGTVLGELPPNLQRMLADWRRQRNPLLQPPPFMSADGTTRINTYLAPLGGQEDGPVLMFLEDAGVLAQKVQQSKLAALGRLSASIAHEIRNPVGALSHASQLLEESAGIPETERRLIDIITVNSRRVNEIVENVLQLSRRDSTRPELIYLAGFLREFVAEFSATLELQEGQVRLAAGEDVEVRMDPGHLRQIVWNLCENAVKYASEAAGGISVEIGFGRMPGTKRPFLEVADRGPGIPEDMREQVFEPFATGRAGGTGLGLFISRELCECNRATLIHEPRTGGGSVFRLVFADPARWEA